MSRHRHTKSYIIPFPVQDKFELKRGQTGPTHPSPTRDLHCCAYMIASPPKKTIKRVCLSLNGQGNIANTRTWSVSRH